MNRIDIVNFLDSAFDKMYISKKNYRIYQDTMRPYLINLCEQDTETLKKLIAIVRAK